MDNQSTYIVGALALGFVLWLAARGRLSAYTAVLWGPTAHPVATGGGGGGSGSIGHAITSAASSAAASAAGKVALDFAAAALV